MGLLQLVVIFVAFLGLGSGRVITSEQESILRSIDELEELTVKLNENKESGAQNEGSGEERVSASRAIPQNSTHDASDEFADEALEVDVTAPPEATARRVRRNPPAEPSCLKTFKRLQLSRNKIIWVPVCHTTADNPIACLSAIAHGHSSRKCELSHYVLIRPENVAVPTNCSCAS